MVKGIIEGSATALLLFMHISTRHRQLPGYLPVEDSVLAPNRGLARLIFESKEEFFVVMWFCIFVPPNNTLNINNRY